MHHNGALDKPALNKCTMAGIERHPHHPLAIDVHAANAEARQRDAADFGERGFRQVLPRCEAQYIAWKLASGSRIKHAIQLFRRSGRRPES
jgi:hypothetical protein